MEGNADDILRLRQLIGAQRGAMIGVRSDGHFLNLPKGVRKAIEEGFELLTLPDLAQIVGMPEATIKLWRDQKSVLEQIKARLDRLRSKDKNLSMTHFIRGEIVTIARIAPRTQLSKELGIARSTIERWMQEGWDKVPMVAPLPEDDHPKVEDMATSQEAKELDVMIARHEGKIRRKYSLSERKLILAVVDRFGSKAVHDRFKVSYDTIARLLRRQNDDAERKARVPIRYAPVLDLMKQHPGMGPMQIRDYLKRHLGISMGVNSVRKVMEQHGWVPPFVRAPRIKDGPILYEAVRRNYLWHMDFKHQYINRCKVFILFIQDDYSRFIVGHAVCDGEKVEAVIAALDDAIRIHGKPEVAMSDGGSAFYAWRGVSQLTRFMEDFGIDQSIAKTPNVNGKLENLNQQVEKELLLTSSFASLEHFAKELATWVGFYNFRRPHQGLGGQQIPADRFFPGAFKFYGEVGEITKQQSLIAETMATLLNELRKSA